jgi:hypothetical protein
VTELDLSFYGLVGSLATDLSKVTGLVHLQIGGNR